MGAAEWIAIVAIACTVLMAVGGAWASMRSKTDVLAKEIELLTKNQVAMSRQIAALQEHVHQLIVRIERLVAVEEARRGIKPPQGPA